VKAFEGIMHEPVRNQLEDLLAGKNGVIEQGKSGIHLASCSECLSEFKAMQAQSELFQSLRAPEELEPAVGFYARVLQTIEDRAKGSIWAGFIYSPVRTRLAYMSLSLAVMLGAYVIAQETHESSLEHQRVAVERAYADTPVFGSPTQQRDAVLINFVSR
jgi:predicted anti-sigma-YlaC factor YlaD